MQRVRRVLSLCLLVLLLAVPSPGEASPYARAGDRNEPVPRDLHPASSGRTALPTSGLGADGLIVHESDLSVCASLEWPNGARFIGTYSAHGALAGPGLKAGTLREVIPIDVADPDDPAGVPGELTGLCTSGLWRDAIGGGATYTLAGRFTGPAAAGEFLLQKVCAVTAGILTCHDSTTEPGPEAETEVVDPCGGPPSDHLASYADICSGSFPGLWELAPSEGDPTKETWRLQGLEAELRLLGEVPERSETVQYAMRWEVDGCKHRWLFNSGVDTSNWTADFAEICSGGSSGFQVDIPPEHVSIGSDRITIRLLLDQELAPIASKFAPGQELSQPSASTFLRLASPDSAHESVVGWDATSEGRAFVIGQDRPPGPS